MLSVFIEWSKAATFEVQEYVRLCWAAIRGTVTRPFYRHDVVEQFREQVNEEFRRYAEGESLDAIGVRAEDRATFVGTLGEIRTAQALEHCRSAMEVIHDLSVWTPDLSRVNANIDHLVCTRRGPVVVDSKIWASLPEISGDLVTADGAYGTAVSTCVYEAQALPSEPALLLLAVGGRAETHLPEAGVRVTLFPDRDGEFQMVPYPIYLVPQSRVAERIDALLPEVAGTHPFSAEQILSSPRLTL